MTIDPETRAWIDDLLYRHLTDQDTERNLIQVLEDIADSLSKIKRCLQVVHEVTFMEDE